MAQCPIRNLHVGEIVSEDPLFEPKEFTYCATLKDGEEFEEESDVVGLVQSSYTRLGQHEESRLGVVRCILIQPKESDDWRRTSIFHTFLKIRGKMCKVIIDNGSHINAIFMETVTRLSLTPVDHPSPYRVSWVDSTSIPIHLWCLISLHFHA